MTSINPDSIDAIALTNEGQVILAVAETEPWTGRDEQLRVLSQKLKTYTAFALDGQLVRLYPELNDREIIVQLDYTSNLPSEIEKLLTLANESYGTDLLKFKSNRID